MGGYLTAFDMTVVGCVRFLNAPCLPSFVVNEKNFLDCLIMEIYPEKFRINNLGKNDEEQKN